MNVLDRSNLPPPDYVGGSEMLCEIMGSNLAERRRQVEILTSQSNIDIPDIPVRKLGFCRQLVLLRSIETLFSLERYVDQIEAFLSDMKARRLH